MAATQGGAAFPATVITDADLEENGGTYVLERQAIPVRRFTDGQRAVQGGSATAVYYVTQAQLDSHEFVRVRQASLPIIEVTGRPTIQRKAVAVILET